MEKKYDLAVIGGGIAGYAAALTAKSLALDCLWLGESGFGEKTRAAEYVRNFPAFSGNGVEFAARLEEQRAREGVALTEARVDGVYAAEGGFSLTCGQTVYSARAVVLATGVETRGSVKGEREFTGRGVSYCAVCDGALYRGKTVAAVISSQKYAHEAQYLAKFARKVYCFCLYQDAAFEAENTEVRFGVPLAVEGDTRVRRLRLSDGTLDVDGVFFLKNSAPPSAIAGGLETDGAHVRAARDCSTNIKGLFAAGDVTGRPYQYVKAAGEGCVAAYSAYAYLREAAKAPER